jgi:hypothetical protein
MMMQGQKCEILAVSVSSDDKLVTVEITWRPFFKEQQLWSQYQQIRLWHPFLKSHGSCCTTNELDYGACFLRATALVMLLMNQIMAPVVKRATALVALTMNWIMAPKF